MTLAQAVAWVEDFGERGITLPPLLMRPAPGIAAWLVPWQDCPCGSEEHQFGGHGAGFAATVFPGNYVGLEGLVP